MEQAPAVTQILQRPPPNDDPVRLSAAITTSMQNFSGEERGAAIANIKDMLSTIEGF
jgi:hypothetical protein